MQTPSVKPLRTADPINRARDAYTTTMSLPGAAKSGAGLARDRFNLSDESRLRDEYMSRFAREGSRPKRKNVLPTLPDMARLYATIFEDVRSTFRNHVGNLIMHAQALDFAWRDVLDALARKSAEQLAMREGDPNAANITLLAEIIGDSHRKFAEVFSTSLLNYGVERAIPPALKAAVKVLTLVQNYELSLSDTMALLYYRKGLESQK